MTTRARLLVLLVTVSLGTSGPLAAPAVVAAGPAVTVDTSLGNEIATGAVSDPDPAHARVTVSNRYHFWAGLDLQTPTGGAQLAPTAIGEDARGLYGLLGLIGPNSTSAWAGTFDPAGSSQAVWVHYDLATPSGAKAFALTSLTIIADTAGAPLLAKSHATVVQAITLITGLDEFTNLLSAVQREDLSPWEVAKAWVHLLESQVARDALRLALADLGVIVSDSFLKSLGTVAGAWDFFQTIRDLLLAGVGGHTSGLVTFAVAGGGPSPSAPAASAGGTSPAPTQEIYVLAPGDTLLKVANRFGVTLEALLAANPQIMDPDRISVGDRVVIPLVPSITYEGVFVPTGSMAVARGRPSVTVLADGRVLVAGGSDASGTTAIASAELYDPRTGTFSPTGSMTLARGYPSVTLLADGMVLVTGGADKSAELYDPVAGIFSPTGSMTMARTLSSATLLADGRVLVMGGFDANDFIATAELYDPRTGAFSPTGSMTELRGRATPTTLLPDGRVLVVGGSIGATVIATAELYDPRTGTFSPTGLMTVARGYPSVTLLADGRVLVVGGLVGSGTNAIASAELYDPRTGTFSPTGLMTVARGLPTATLLADGRVLVAGGAGRSAELYDPVAGGFSLTGSMTVHRSFSSATLLADGRVLVLGGLDAAGNPITSAELFQ